MKVFEILSGKVHVVELPERHQQAFEALKNGRELTINRKRKSANVDHITFDFDFAEQLFIGGFLACTSGNLDTGDRHYLFGLGWQMVGMLSEVTEEQAAVLVQKRIHPWDHKLWTYRDYTREHKFPRDAVVLHTALQSLESAILAENWCFENPYGEEPVRLPEGHNSRGTHESMWNQWKEGQSRVLDRSRCLLLGRVGG